MQHETKTYSAEFKAIDAARGTFEAVVSVFGNVDLGGDRVMPGAFTDTLAAWKAKGDPIPVIWSHEWDDPKSHIGVVTEAAERPDLGGLWVRGSMDVDANDRAAYVARLLKQRRVTQFSFGYSTKDSRLVTDENTGETVRELLALDLFEVGPTLLGMNPATQLLEAASATGAKAPGRTLSRKDERSLARARDLIDAVLNPAPEQAESASRVEVESKARPDEVAEGVFVAWTDGRGRIEHLMLDGVLGVPESEYRLDATAADPAVLVRVFEQDGSGWQETENLLGFLASQVQVIAPLTDSPDEQTYSGNSADDQIEAKGTTPEPHKTEDAGNGTEDPGSRDSADRLSNDSELVHLLARTRYEENNQ